LYIKNIPLNNNRPSRCNYCAANLLGKITLNKSAILIELLWQKNFTAHPEINLSPQGRCLKSKIKSKSPDNMEFFAD